jgi:hypothetical protein
MEYSADLLPVVSRLVACGFTKPKEIAHVLGLSVPKWREWLELAPELAAAVSDGKEKASQTLVAQAFREACGYEFTETEERFNKDGELTSKIVRQKYKVPSESMITFLLTNLSDGRFKSTKHIETKSMVASIEVRGKIEGAAIDRLAGKLNAVREFNRDAGGVLVADTEGSSGESCFSQGASRPVSD